MRRRDRPRRRRARLPLADELGDGRDLRARRRARRGAIGRHAFRTAVLAFGGVDIVVSNAGIASSAPLEETTLELWDRNNDILARGYFLVAREAARVLRAQGIGGSIVFIGSKNALAPGKNAAAYSAAKAASLHLARCLAEELGPDGIRVNTVNPDAVLEGSRIWDSAWREERARAYGIAADELEEHYRARTTLKVNVAARGHRRGRAVLRLAAARRQEHRQHPQRRRRRRARVPALR